MVRHKVQAGEEQGKRLLCQWWEKKFEFDSAGNWDSFHRESREYRWEWKIIWEMSAVMGMEGGRRLCTCLSVLARTFLWVIFARVFRERESCLGRVLHWKWKLLSQVYLTKCCQPV